MLESGTYGSVRGASSNGRPYRNPRPELDLPIDLPIERRDARFADSFRASIVVQLPRQFTRVVELGVLDLDPWAQAFLLSTRGERTSRSKAHEAPPTHMPDILMHSKNTIGCNQSRDQYWSPMR